MAKPTGERLYTCHETMFRSAPVAFVIECLLFPFGIGAFFLIRWWIRSISTKLTITTERVSLRRGILARSLNEVLRRNVRNVQLEQTFFQRLLGVGDIGVSSSGQSDIEIIAHGIRDPMRVKALIDSAGPGFDVPGPGFDVAGPVVFVGVGGLSSFLVLATALITPPASADRKPVNAPNAVQQAPQAQPVEQPVAQVVPKVDEPKLEPVIAAEQPTTPVAAESTDDKKPEPVEAEADQKAEKEADSKLKMARLMISTNKPAAKKRLQEIIDKFPSTKAADEAKSLLPKTE